MKKAPLLTALFTLLFVLSACGSNSASTNSSGSSSSSTNSFRSSASTPLTPEAKLALGTIKLEGTKLAVDSNMAANLLPLWQLLFQLLSSSSSAPQEVTAVVDQIHTTMTSEQIATINSMTLSQADIFTVFQQQAQSNSGGTSGSGSTGGNRGNGGGGGFFFAGGPPGGGGFPGGGFRNNGGGTGSNGGAQTSTVLTEAQAAAARQNALSNLLINQVIRLLETKLKA